MVENMGIDYQRIADMSTRNSAGEQRYISNNRNLT
jgi:hypothetical protein